MSNQELNTLLYHKMYAEQEKYKQWLLEQSPSVILENAYRYCMQEDMLMCFENNDLEDAQAKALLRIGDPLYRLYHQWDSSGAGHMDQMWECAEKYATEMQQKQAKAQDKGR